MALIQGLIAALLRSAGKILNTAFGWATMTLFGRVPQERQVYLSHGLDGVPAGSCTRPKPLGITYATSIAVRRPLNAFSVNSSVAASYSARRDRETAPAR
jgi:hypothetical protein